MLAYFESLGGIGYILTTVVTGLIVVFFGLVLLIAFVSLLGKIFNPKKKQTNSSSTGNGASLNSTGSMSVENGVSDEVVAAIAAAIAAMSSDGKSYAIRSIKKSRASGRPAWAAAGIYENTRPF